MDDKRNTLTFHYILQSILASQLANGYWSTNKGEGAWKKLLPESCLQLLSGYDIPTSLVDINLHHNFL